MPTRSRVWPLALERARGAFLWPSSNDVFLAVDLGGMNAPKALAEILEIANEDDFSYAIVAYVNDKQIEHGFKTLTEIERIVLLANDCEYRIIRGGLTDVLLNPGESWRDAMIAAVAEIGATRTARILRAGAALFDAIPADKKQSAETDDDLLALAGEEALDALRGELDAAGGEAEVSGALASYIVRCRERFRPE